MRSSAGDVEKRKRTRKREGVSGADFSTTRADSATQAAKCCYWSGRELAHGDSGKPGK